MEIGDTLEQDRKTMNGNSSFSFEASHAPRIESVTPTKFSKNSTPGPIIRKNPRIHHFQDISLLTQILSKLDVLSETVESQTAHIVALEKRVEELTSHSKGQTQAIKANRGVTKKIETMPDRVATMAATSSAQPGSTNESTPSQGSSRPGVQPTILVIRSIEQWQMQFR
ncbi:hypothetical protein MMC31_003608 [Peltigera leucophlebia]|nr:hypothetical protein [Peltigera leucophlebia]